MSLSISVCIYQPRIATSEDIEGPWDEACCANLDEPFLSYDAAYAAGLDYVEHNGLDKTKFYIARIETTGLFPFKD